MQIFIREAHKEDADTIVGFQIAMAQETESIQLNRETVERGVMAVFYDSKKGRYFVASDREVLVASTLITPEWSDWRNGYVYWIQSVYVLPHYRKRKVFTKMYEYLQNFVLQDTHAICLRLYVDKTNLKAQQVYEHLGMNGDHYKLYEWMKQ